MKAPILPVRNKGFALIVTLSLMILLTVIAVGLLSLSSISLRASGQGEAMATAKANARLALMMALGELQKSLGPDRAITATSEILGTAAAAPIKPNLTGVWKSWDDFNPAAATPPDYLAQKKDSTEDPNGRFRRWLVSSTDPAGPTTRNFANSPWVGNTVELVGAGSLGTTAPNSAKVTAGLVPVAKGGKIQGSYAWHVADESVKARINSYRDPSQNTTLAQKRALLAGHRPDASVITGADGTQMNFLPTDSASGSGQETKTAAKNFELAKENSNKLINLEQISLLENGTKTTNGKSIGKIKQFRNDVTPYSLGVMADVRRGGLKEDLSSVFEMSTASSVRLPAEFSGTGINPVSKTLYQSTQGVTGLSDPYWSTLAGYYNSFKTIITPDTQPTLELKLPTTATSLTADLTPKTFFPGPVIAKVETVFSLVTREDTSTWMGADWAGHTADLRKKCAYAVNLIFTPQITLHNPYNVQISFHRLTVTLNNVPVAFQFFRDSIGPGSGSQSVNIGDFECMNQMLENRDIEDDDLSTPLGTKVNENKKFVIHIGNWNNTKPYSAGDPTTQLTGGNIIMKPGEVLVCTPYLDENLTFDTESHINTDDAGSTKPVVFFDYNNKITTRGLKARPGIRPGLGFELNGISPSHTTGKALTLETTLSPGQIDGVNFWWFLLRDNTAENPEPGEINTAQDSYHVEYKIQQPQFWKNGVAIAPGAPLTKVNPTFEVGATITPNAGGVEIDYAKLSFKYGNNTNLQSFFDNRTYRYPPVGSYVGKSKSDTNEAFVSQKTKLGYQFNVKPFAVFSAYARTTNGGVFENKGRTPSTTTSFSTNLLKDGRLAGKPFLFHNPSRAIFDMDLATGIPGAQAYELNFQPFLSKGDYESYMDASEDPLTKYSRVPALTANTTARGIKSGSYLEIPTGPLQTIADLRRSNALTSSYLPQFVQPVGNSLLHPLMSTNKVIESNAAISATPLLDHSVLANHAFYDRFYFSTFAARDLDLPGNVFEKFMNYIDPQAAPSALRVPLPSQAFKPYLPVGKTGTTAKADLFVSGVPKSTAYKNAAEYQMIQGPFNVNSTNVSAWKAVLASMNKSEVATFWARVGIFNKTNDTVTSKGTPIFGMSLLNGGLSGDTLDASKIDDVKTNDWNGYRELTDTQLTTLATDIVMQVRLRGPFLSMSEFVNRQIGPESELTLTGALEKAIINSRINENFMNMNKLDAKVTELTAADFSNATKYNYKTLAATIGNPAAGAPGWVSQGDLLRILEPAATVRSDTFVIRVCGEAKDASGKVTARAFAEAVVQRVPDYVDPVDRPSSSAYDITVPGLVPTTASVTNKNFGRRMDVVSFRWLSSNEI